MYLRCNIGIGLPDSLNTQTIEKIKNINYKIKN